MQDEHRKVIQKNFGSLVEQTDLDVMVSALYEKGVFFEQMIESYRDTNKDTRTRKRQLYMDITRRGPDAFGHLLDALEENGYWNLVRDLNPTSSLQPRNLTTKPSSRSGESSYVSIRKERERTKSGVEVSKKLSDQSIVPTTPTEEEKDKEKDMTDPSVDIPYFKVVKSTNFYEVNGNDIKLYPTRRRRRGILVVFNYIEFRNDIEEYRRGVDIDCKMLKHVFHEIGFSVIAYQNLTKQETLTTLKLLEEVLVGTECVFIVVSSHGYERAQRGSDIDIRCSDGELISYYTIIERFSNVNFPALRGVPKVFVFQVCRGRNEEWLLTPRLREVDGGDEEVGQESGPRRGPRTRYDGVGKMERPVEHHADRTYSDILIAHSTLPGFVSRRDPEKGSWYIQVLCEVFAARAHDCHVEKLFTLIDEELHNKFAIQTSSVDKWGFNRRLYLHPGLYED